MQSVLKKFPFSRSLIILLVWFSIAFWNFKYLGKLHSFADILSATQHLDVAWYKKIAVGGYSIDPTIVDGQSTVFFPLFPLISAVFIHVFTIDPLLALNIGQKICLIVMSYLIYRWLKDHQFSTDEGFLAVLLHPALVFLIVPYTESLYLCCLFGLLISWHRKNLEGVFLSAFLLSLCRPTGLFVLPAAALTLIFHFLSVYRRKNTRVKPSLAGIKNVAEDEEFGKTAKLLISASTGAIIALVVIAVVMHISVGDWYAFYRYRSLWNEKPGLINFVGFLNLDYGYRFPSILVTWLSIAGSIILAMRGFLFEGILCLLPILLPAYQGKMSHIIRYSLGAAPAWVMLYMSLGRHRLLQMGLIGFSISVAMLMIDAWIRRVWVG